MLSLKLEHNTWHTFLFGHQAYELVYMTDFSLQTGYLADQPSIIQTYI